LKQKRNLADDDLFGGLRVNDCSVSICLTVFQVPVASTAGLKIAASELDKFTQSLIKLIFDNDMFRDTMKKFDIGKS